MRCSTSFVRPGATGSRPFRISTGPVPGNLPCVAKCLHFFCSTFAISAAAADRRPDRRWCRRPTGGNIVQVPDTNIVVELTAERIAASGGSRKEAAKSRIVAYFYESSSASPLSPAPSEVKVSLGGSGTGRCRQPCGAVSGARPIRLATGNLPGHASGPDRLPA